MIIDLSKTWFIQTNLRNGIDILPAFNGLSIILFKASQVLFKASCQLPKCVLEARVGNMGLVQGRSIDLGDGETAGCVLTAGAGCFPLSLTSSLNDVRVLHPPGAPPEVTALSHFGP